MGILLECGSPARSVSISLRFNTENSSIVRLLFVVYQHVVLTNTLYSRLFCHYTHVTNTKTTKTCVLHTTSQRLATGSAGRELRSTMFCPLVFHRANPSSSLLPEPLFDRRSLHLVDLARFPLPLALFAISPVCQLPRLNLFRRWRLCPTLRHPPCAPLGIALASAEHR